MMILMSILFLIVGILGGAFGGWLVADIKSFGEIREINRQYLTTIEGMTVEINRLRAQLGLPPIP